MNKGESLSVIDAIREIWHSFEEAPPIPEDLRRSVQNMEATTLDAIEDASEASIIRLECILLELWVHSLKTYPFSGETLQRIGIAEARSRQLTR